MLLSDLLDVHCIVTLMVIFVQLRRPHLQQREDYAVSSVFANSVQLEGVATG